MSSARAAFYFLGIVLLAVAAIIVGRQFAASEPIEWQAPCLIALVGLGAAGLGVFSSLESTQSNECNDPRADATGDIGADPD
jgi:predicted metal-binding membrane protein